MTKLKVMKTGRTWGVFVVEENPLNYVLLEGGFFYETSALEAKSAWERDLLDDEVEIAERKAGWDPNP